MDFGSMLDNTILSYEKRMPRKEMPNLTVNDEDKLWADWDNIADKEAELYVFPNGIKIISGLFYFLLESYGIEILLEAIDFLAKRRDRYNYGSDYFIILSEIIPIACMKKTKMHIISFKKKRDKIVIEEMQKDKSLSLRKARQIATKRLLC